MNVKITIYMLTAVSAALPLSRSHATPYASGVKVTGTSVSFILNETADSLTYSINGGPALPLIGTAAGTKTFSLSSASDQFSIVASKSATSGFTMSSGMMTSGTDVNGWRIASAISGTSLVSNPANVLTRFNSPRGVAVNTSPNTANFGTAYVSNSALTPAPFSSRPNLNVTGEGLFALRADGSDAFGYGDVGKNPTNVYDGVPAFATTSPNSPFRVTVNSQGEVLVADFADVNSNAFLVDPSLMQARNYFPAYTGTAPLTPGLNHGSSTAVYSTGSLANGDLLVYTLDEDISTQYFIDGTEGTDQNSLWRYNIGGGPLPSAVIPTRVVGGALLNRAVSDFDFGKDGKIYLAQNRSVGAEAGIFVYDSSGTQLFNSLDATRTLLNNPTAPDIFVNTFGIAVSPDQKWLAIMIGRGDVGIIPLVNGIPDIAGRLVAITAFANTESGRDITFDAAGNIHYVSSGQGWYKVLAPGGNTVATTAWDGSQFTFAVTSPPTATDNADFDGTGAVDGSDFLLWQRGLGTGMTHATGDANNDQLVNNADLTIWKTQYGTTPLAVANGGTVPEPSSALQASLALVGWLAVRRRSDHCACTRTRRRLSPHFPHSSATFPYRQH